MEQAVLILRAIGCGQARYYLDGPGPGRWMGAGCPGLGLHGDVDGEELSAVLGGRGPDGSRLLARIPTNRRAGFDLVFAAPKSVSLLAALAPAAEAVKVRWAHDAAVGDVLDYLERRAVRTRRGRDGRRIATAGLIGVAFGHGTSWAGDPHLHTHVVLANMVRGADGGWSCLDRIGLSRHTRAASALYQASLRHHLASQGLRLAWQVRADGLADVAGVPRAAIDACSSRRRQLLAAAGAAGAAGAASARARAAAAGRTRLRGAAGPSPGWEARAAEAGLDRTAVADLLSGSAPVSVGVADLDELLVSWSSVFTRPDVVAAVAATAPVDWGVAAIERVVDRFLGSAVRVNDGRWTTSGMQELEQAMVAVVSTRWRSVGLVPPETAETAIRARPSLDADQSAAVRRLTTDGSGVDLLEAGCLVRQAAVIDAAAVAWGMAGHRVAVLTRSDRASARWHALTGLAPPPPPPQRASILIVDGADHWPTVELHRLVDDLAAGGGKLVLVAGGTTRPRREPASVAITAMAERVGTIGLGPDRAAAWSTAKTVRAGRDGTVVVAPTPTVAARQMVADWDAALRAGRAVTMVALGPEEAEHLNRLARASRAAAGGLTGPVITAGGRDFQAGDEVRIVRRDRRLGVSAGRLGQVTGVDPARGEVTVWWGDRSRVVAAATLAGGSVTHGYATTAPFVRHDRPEAVLALGPYSGRDAVVYICSPMPIRRPGSDRVEALISALSPPARARPCPAEQSLAELAGERNRLAAALLAAAPADRSAELRRLDEDLAWLAASPAHGAPARLADLRQRREALGQEQSLRAAWLETHREDLERWAALEAAASWRTEALARGAELAPTRAVTDRLGLPPADERSRGTWREAAGAIEAYRDRWAIPDGPLPDRGTPDPAWEPARQLDQLRMLGACRAAGRNLGPERAAEDDLAISSR
jgi:conjugative relaxase-like TrwC/TraI family protein